MAFSIHLFSASSFYTNFDESFTQGGTSYNSYGTDPAMRQKYTSVATYKGTFVAVRKLNKRSVDLTRTVLMELKQVRFVSQTSVHC